MTAEGPGAVVVGIRPVQVGDLEVLYAHQRDPEATAMAAFPSREREAFDAHWLRILADPNVLTRAVEEDGLLVGNIGSWLENGERLVGYWIDRDAWGRGVATRALALFLAEVPERPLWARVAVHNVGSARVLRKCGFVEVGKPVRADSDDVEEQVFRLDAD